MCLFILVQLTQTDCFIETIDALQSTLDKYADVAPVKMLGDLNVKLPHLTNNAKWYTKSGYNQYSRIMYDFISSNQLICLDLKHPQTINTHISVSKVGHTLG